MTTVYFQGGAAEAQAIIRAFVGALTGSDSRYAREASGVFMAVGFAALSDIQQDFIRKARGGTGEDGNKWKPLDPKTLAYSRRFGPGEKAQLKRAAGLGPANRQRGLLTAAQNKRWRQIFGTRLARFAESMPVNEAMAAAAAVAWATVKREGAKTKIEVFGNRPHEILRDTGVLLNSLSPGRLVQDNYIPSTPDQVFETLADGVIVGTNVAYAGKQNETRPFVPREDQIPRVWRERWIDAGKNAIVVALQIVMGRG